MTCIEIKRLTGKNSAYKQLPMLVRGFSLIPHSIVQP